MLDTNVCLDLLVFRDPAVAALAAALQDGRLQALTDSDCRGEWRRVLGYPLLALDASERDRLLAEYDGLVHVLAAPPDISAGTARLPRCADPDDQKFLQLAQRGGARWLLSRDRELLKLSRRTLRDHGFEVVTPQQWRQSTSTSTAPPQERRVSRTCSGPVRGAGDSCQGYRRR